MITNARDHYTIREIAERASAIFLRLEDTDVPWRYIAAELTIVHDEIVPLRLDDMLAGPDEDFMHDICGIHRHLEIGKPSKLTDCFLPRYARV
jgi:hypothetical protein